MRRAVDEYHIHYEQSRIWEKTKWFGVPCWKLPFDAFIIQEIIHELRPEYIIETGTGKGGSAVFYASICELLGEGKIITVDIDAKVDHNKIQKYEWTDRIKFMHGGSTNKLIFEKIWEKCKGKRNLVILDSDHSYEYVRQEMSMYSTLVPVDSFMIVEDTHVSGHPVPWKWGKGPYEAVDDFLKVNPNWLAEFWCEKYIMTFNPKGYIRRTK